MLCLHCLTTRQSFCSESVRDTPEHVLGREMTFEQQRQPQLVFT
jgi:hypothetical protein